MLIERNITPVGHHAHSSDELVEALKLADSTGQPYKLNAAGTCVEGDRDEVMLVVQRCPERLRQQASHMVTMVQIQDDAGKRGKLHSRYSLGPSDGGPPARSRWMRGCRTPLDV